MHRLRCTSVFWAHFYSRLIKNFQILDTLKNGWIQGGYLNMTYVVKAPWFPLLLHKCILLFLIILKKWKFFQNLLLKSPTKMDVRLILIYMGPVYSSYQELRKFENFAFGKVSTANMFNHLFNIQIHAFPIIFVWLLSSIIAILI